LILKLQRNSIFKKCQQTFFQSKSGKSGQIKFILFTFLLFCNIFIRVQILGKFLKPIFPYNIAVLMPFTGFETLSAAKNTNATFFSGRRKY